MSDELSECAQAEPVEAKEPWKPIKGEKVLVEAVISPLRPDREGYVDAVVEDHYYATSYDNAVSTEIDSEIVRVPLSQLRPLPVVQGEDLK